MTLAIGLFAGGAHLAPAFGAVAQDWGEVEGRLTEGAAGVLVYSRPAETLARALEAGAAPADVVTDWAKDARRILAACEAHGEGCTLICADDARAAPDRARALLTDRFGLKADPADFAAAAVDPLYRLVAQAILASEPEVAALAAALDARALPLGESAAEDADPAAALEALRAMRASAAAAREEIALLRGHLHLVQSQLETYYRRAREAGPAAPAADAAIAALKAELGAARAEADSYRASISWRLTAPLRAIAARLPAGFSPSSLRLRRQVALLRDCELFDAAWYLDTYSDIAAAGLDPAEHYVRFGWREGRRPGPDFDGPGYLRMNPDVAALGMNPLLHYIEHGKAEGRPLAPRLTRVGESA